MDLAKLQWKPSHPKCGLEDDRDLVHYLKKKVGGEGQQHDEVMADTMIEVMVEERSQISGKDPNPFWGQNGEVLHAHLERSFSGFLVRRDAIKFKVNSEKLLARITMLKDLLLIGKFVAPSNEAVDPSA